MKLTQNDLNGLGRVELEILCLAQDNKINALTVSMEALRSGLVYKAMQKNIDELTKVIKSMKERDYVLEQGLKNMVKMQESANYTEYPASADQFKDFRIR
jgi:hypothetical protein